MKYLFIFIKKQSFLFMFIVLEVIALLLLFNHNNFQQSRAINTTNVITGSVNHIVTVVSDYFSLNEANRQLNIQNAKLLESLHGKVGISEFLIDYDTIYTYIPARVISNTSRNRNNYIMINRGRADGIEKEMGLVSPFGIAGNKITGAGAGAFDRHRTRRTVLVFTIAGVG